MKNSNNGTNSSFKARAASTARYAAGQAARAAGIAYRGVRNAYRTTSAFSSGLFNRPGTTYNQQQMKAYNYGRELNTKLHTMAYNAKIWINDNLGRAGRVLSIYGTRVKVLLTRAGRTLIQKLKPVLQAIGRAARTTHQFATGRKINAKIKPAEYFKSVREGSKAAGKARPTVGALRIAATAGAAKLVGDAINGTNSTRDRGANA